MPRSFLAKSADDRVDLGLRVDVDAARRLVENDDLRVQRDALGDGDLLLVAAGEVRHDEVLARGLDVELLDGVLGDGAALRAVDEHVRFENLRSCGSEMLSLSDISSTSPHLPRSSETYTSPASMDFVTEWSGISLPSTKTLPLSGGGEAAGGERELGAARARQARDADDLALVHVQADVVDEARPASGAPRGTPRRRL
jgi:hypothetical protein